MATTINNSREIQPKTPIKAIPKAEIVERDIQDTEQIIRPTPSTQIQIKDNPQLGNAKNCVYVKGKAIEIKPTKLKYHRNRTALFYRVIDNIPLPEILAADKEVFDADRDGDKCMMDWLIAVFDDTKFVEKNYNDFDSETIYTCLEIFKRLNGIKDTEEKNMKAKETKA